MNKVVKLIVIAAAISQAGCATTARRQAETDRADSKLAADTIKVCENAIYYSSDYDQATTLHCANILDIWH